MIDFSELTAAMETLLKDNLKDDFLITRNEEINIDANTASIGKGWVGVYRGKVDYEPYTTGNRPWLASPEIMVIVQVADAHSGYAAEDKLQAAEKAVVDVIESDRTIKGTVMQIVGYSMEYTYNKDNAIYFHGVMITVKTEVRS